MNIGNEVLKTIFLNHDFRPLLDAGLDRSWLNSRGVGAEAVFSGEERQAYSWVLDHWDKHHKVPLLKQFRENFPESVVPFDDDPPLNIAEVVDEAVRISQQSIIQSSVSDLVDLYDEGNIGEAIEKIKAASHQLTTNFSQEGTSVTFIGDPNFDLDEELDKQIEPGVPLGIPSVDEDFFGFQPGQLITVLGRQKSSKTTLVAKSLHDAWEAGYSGLFFSVEMNPQVLQQRVLSIGAHVDPEKFRRGQLTEGDKAKVKDLYKRFSYDIGDVNSIISKKRTLITMDDVIHEAQKYRPHFVIIDGFYFMKDRITGKTAGPDWQAHENLAAELKTFAEAERIPIVVTTQVQEKQYDKTAGVEAASMMGGTGLLRYSDLVLGLERAPDGVFRLTNLLSRFAPVRDVNYFVDWPSMKFTYTFPEDEEK